MIIQTFDRGWGPEWPVKQLEMEITDRALRHWKTDASRTVLINSTWYSREFHDETMAWLRHNDWSHIIMVAMIDPAIPQSGWFQEFSRPVLGLGSYPGAGDLTFWAHALDRHFVDIGSDILEDTASIDHAYLCLNRKPHWHRRRLYDQLSSRNLLDHGLVSMGTDGHGAERRLPLEVDSQDLSPNSGSQYYGMPNDNASLGHLSNWRRCFINIVTETVYDIRKNWFVSEKTFKPILGLRPFLVYDPDGARTWLDHRKFENYTRDFQDITDLDLSDPDNTAPFLEILTQSGPAYWKKKYLDLVPKMRYNKQRFRELLFEEQNFLDQGLPCQI